MSRAVVPIAQLGNRLPTAGRLRIGEKRTAKSGKTYPAKLDRWRATSEDRQAIEQIANVYGGRPEKWAGAPSGEQWQVTTEATELRVVLPPDCLGGTPIYELWAGGGCQRRCDGETCQTVREGPDGPEPSDVPCVCAAQGAMACKPMTRLAVVLPDIRFGGAWRLDTGGWNAARELPGMVAMIQSLQAQGLTRGILGLQHRRQQTGKTTRQFVVPVLRIDGSMDELAAGQRQVRALASGGQTALGSGSVAGGGQAVAGEVGWTPPPATTQPYDDDGVVDGEVVDVEPAPAPNPDDEKVSGALLRALHAALREVGVDDAARKRLLGHYGITTSKDLTRRQARALIDRCKSDPDTVRKAAGGTS